MLNFDHIIISVADLDAAIRNFTALGFTVVRGGRHASGTTHNALIVLEDGTYIELIALTGDAPQNDAADYSFLLRDGEGFVGYCLQTQDLLAEAAEMQARGVAHNPVSTGGRQRTDGVALRWRTVTLPNTMSPFFIEDVSARALRVPTDSAYTQHANGVTGISSITVLVDDVQAAIFRYWQLTGQAVAMAAPDSVMYVLEDDISIYLAEPVDDAMRAHFAQRPHGPYLLTLNTSDATRSGLLDVTHTHTARIVLVQ